MVEYRSVILFDEGSVFAIQKKYILIVLLLIICAFSIYLIWANNAVEVSEYILQSSRVPEAFNGFRIVQVSDLHNAEIGKGNKTLLNKLRNSRPNIIVITGDMIDSRRTDLNVALEFAAGAVEIAPVYYVPGNHEGRISEYETLKKGLEDLGICVLESTTVYIESGLQRICLSGVYAPRFYSDSIFGGTELILGVKLAEIVTDTTQYNILLSHHPEAFSLYANYNYDLIFAGHAHGGQVRLPWIGGLWAPDQGFFPKYQDGLYSQGNTNMVVSRGVGNSLFPIRIFNNPEIVVVELNHK